MIEMRLQKFIAQAGIASRRKAEELIKEGRISVNGKVIVDMGHKVSENDEIEFDLKAIKKEEKLVYFLLNKPCEYVTTVKDQFGRPAVVDLLMEINERVYPIGRLDYDTSGLLILTNDGDFTYRLTHPKHEIDKVYIAKIQGIPDDSEINKFEKGILLDNRMTSNAKFKILEHIDKDCIVEITIHEGRNRQIRRMCEAIGHNVLELKRIKLGELELGNLEESKYRALSEEEILYLKK